MKKTRGRKSRWTVPVRGCEKRGTEIKSSEKYMAEKDSLQDRKASM